MKAPTPREMKASLIGAWGMYALWCFSAGVWWMGNPSPFIASLCTIWAVVYWVKVSLATHLYLDIQRLVKEGAQWPTEL